MRWSAKSATRKPKEAYLEQALEEGFASGVYQGDAFADVRRELGLKERPR